MSRQRVEVQIEPIAGEQRQTARGQSLSQRVDEQVRHVLGARTQVQHGQDLGARVDGKPYPEHLSGAAQPRAEFVQLHVREVEVAEGAFVQELRVQARTRQPGSVGDLLKAEDACGS